MAVKDLRSSLSSLPCAFARRWMVSAAVLVILSWVSRTDSQGQFTSPSNEICACRGEVLTYMCTVEGGTATLWDGSAFTCNQGEITLIHSPTRQEAQCNGINGQLIPSGGQRYTSELRVNVTNELNDTTVRCSLSSGSLTTIGSSSILVRSSPYQQLPNVTLTNASTNTLRFTWDSVDPTCSSITYESTTSGCGTCSIATNPATPMATCTGWQLPSMCTFSVQSVICGFTGMPSDTVAVSLKVPDAPQVAIIPVYSADMNSLAKFVITIYQATNNVMDPLFGAITHYTTSYSDGMQRNTACMDNQCEYEISGPFQDCTSSSSSTTSVTVSAANVFGQGQASMPQTFGCTNDFVRVEYIATSSMIICSFLNTMDTNVKSCTVMYGECGQELTQRVEGNSTTASITLLLDPGENLECYVVIASNDTFTVRVDNRITTPQGSSSTVVIAVVVPIAVILILAIICIVTVLAIMHMRKSKDEDHVGSPRTVQYSTDTNKVDTEFNETIPGQLPPDKN